MKIVMRQLLHASIQTIYGQLYLQYHHALSDTYSVTIELVV